MLGKKIFKTIWGVIYPYLIYFFISNLISMVYMSIISVKLVADLSSTVSQPDVTQITETLLETLTRDSMLLTAISCIVTIPIFLLLFNRDKNLGRHEDKIQLRVNVYIIAMLAGTFLCCAINNIVAISGITDLFPSYEQVEESLYGGNVIPEFIAAVIGAPIVEELLFRGFIYNRLRININKKAAMIISAVLFGIYHGNVPQGIYAFGVGIVCVYIYDRCKNIIAPMLVHACSNMISVILVETSLLDGIYSTIVGTVIMTLLLIILGIYLIQVLNTKTEVRKI